MALLVVLFVVAPIVELFVIIRVASEIGALTTIALLIAISFVGAALVKRQGLAVFGRLQRAAESGQDPSRTMVDAFLVLAAGALLLAPGFVTDVLGLLLLLPPVRALVAPIVLRRVKRGTRTRVVRITRSRRMGDVIDTDATVDPSQHRQPGSLPPGLP